MEKYFIGYYDNYFKVIFSSKRGEKSPNFAFILRIHWTANRAVKFF